MNIYFRRDKYIWQKKKIFNPMRISFRWQKIIIQCLKKPNFIYKFDNKNISTGSDPSARALGAAHTAKEEGTACCASRKGQRRPVYLERNHRQGPFFSNNIPIGVPFGCVSPWLMRWFTPSPEGYVCIFPNSIGLRELPNEFARQYTETYTHREKDAPRRRRLSLINIPTFVTLSFVRQSASRFSAF